MTETVLIDNRLFTVLPVDDDTLVLKFKGFGEPLPPPPAPKVRKRNNHTMSPRAKSSPWTAEDEAELVRRYKRGEDYFTISRRMNRTHMAVAQRATVLRKRGLIS